MGKDETTIKLSLTQILQEVVNQLCSQKAYSKILSAISIENDMLLALFDGLHLLGERFPCDMAI